MKALYKPPFPWFGGKSRVSELVWERFGEVHNYVEPFAGSLAEHKIPKSWACVPWKAAGGYGSQGSQGSQGSANAHLERIWFSPHCLAPASVKALKAAA